ncbi:chaperone DnaJ [Sphaceloma murrayae]|uniref:Chaperone DnaJ n=1 Tax=Sphaceloma murrayae TaxID=2082308 RepID=A0A2K1QPQ6_9PEZI|nr:chaperone DnaJ [Sphaceloma murrayae]
MDVADHMGSCASKRKASTSPMPSRPKKAKPAPSGPAPAAMPCKLASMATSPSTDAIVADPADGPLAKTQSAGKDEGRMLMSIEDKQRTLQLSHRRPSYFSQYRPDTDEDKGKWSSPPAKHPGLFEYLNDRRRGEIANEETDTAPGVETTDAKGKQNLVPEAALALAHLSKVEGAVIGPDKILVQTSLFVGVMLNMHSRYGTNVERYLRRVLPKEATKEDYLALGMSESVAEHSWLESMGRKMPLPGLAAGDLAARDNLSRSKLEMKHMVQRWQSLYPGVLGVQGSQMIQIDLKAMMEAERATTKERGFLAESGCRPVLMPSAFLAELEAEAARRIKGTVVFRGLDGSRQIVKPTKK